MDCQTSSCNQSLVPPCLKSSKKFICFKCAHWFAPADIEAHQSLCDGQEGLIYYCPKIEDQQISFIKEVDMFDLPVSKASVQYSEIGKSGHRPINLETAFKSSESLKVEDCCFCSGNIKIGQKYAILPCGHYLHTKCVKKWLIIVEPCKICNDSSELSETCYTDTSLKSLKGSI